MEFVEIQAVVCQKYWTMVFLHKTAQVLAVVLGLYCDMELQYKRSNLVPKKAWKTSPYFDPQGIQEQTSQKRTAKLQQAIFYTLIVSYSSIENKKKKNIINSIL